MSIYKSTIEAITEFLFIETPITKSDLIFVFGNEWVATIDKVYELYSKGIANKILITGHSSQRLGINSEANIFMHRAIELGIPETALIIEPEATSTKENLQLSVPLIDNHLGLDNVKQILFVCKAFHTRRVLMTARKFLPSTINFQFVPMKDERNIQKDNWWKDSIALDRTLAEVRRIAEYTLKGDLSIDS